ncbi:hypothetical protein [Methylobacterium indicum]|uniref:hypothetical protein n=1 Tax=Methylobacterium indicum TaxID=1775910 RepID=UPI00243535E4|nr:hypothetical protein [Methylobacterium indicum]
MTFHKLSHREKAEAQAKTKYAFDVRPGLGAFYRPIFLSQKLWTAVIFEGDFKDFNGQISKGLSHSAVSTAICGDLEYEAADWYSIDPRVDADDVRNRYLEPSYFISDNFNNFCIVSDGDYYWAVAARNKYLKDFFAIDSFSCLEDFRVDIEPYKKSMDNHNKMIGSMLMEYLEICRESIT